MQTIKHFALFQESVTEGELFEEQEKEEDEVEVKDKEEERETGGDRRGRGGDRGEVGYSGRGEVGRGKVYCQDGGCVRGAGGGGHAGILRCGQREKWDGW